MLWPVEVVAEVAIMEIAVRVTPPMVGRVATVDRAEHRTTTLMEMAG
jgi:hypothetical protein